MVNYSKDEILLFFKKGDDAHTSNEKGKHLEDLLIYIFDTIPGIKCYDRNIKNDYNTEEIDIGIWNDQYENGLLFLPNMLLVECKNWSKKTGSEDLSWFIRKVTSRGLEYGFFITSMGITGQSENHSAAFFELSQSIADGIRIIILTRDEIEKLTSTEDFVQLVKIKLCRLIASMSY